MQYGKCAVVGNGASLSSASAEAIDSADAVLRINGAPIVK